MPRAPDWLLGFGFTARDRGLNRYLETIQKSLSSVEEGFSAVERSAKNLRASRADIQRFSEAARSMEVPEMPEFGNPHNPLDPEEIRGFGEEFRRIVQRIAPDFNRLREMAKKVGESTLREFDRIFGSIRHETEDTIDGFRDLITEIKRIPGVSPSLVRAVRSIEERFASKQITVAEVAGELEHLEDEVRRAVRAAEPFRRAMLRMEEALRTPGERLGEFAKQFDEWSDAVAGLFEPISEADIKRMFGAAVVGATKLVAWSLKSIFKWAKKAGPIGKHFAGKGFFEYLFGKKLERDKVKKDLYETAKFLREEERKASRREDLSRIGEMAFPEEVAGQIELLSKEAGKAAKDIEGFAEDFDKAAENIQKADPSRAFRKSFQKMARDIKKWSDSIEGDLGKIAGTFVLVRRVSSKQMKGLSEEMQASALKLRTIIAEDIGQIRVVVDEAFNSVQGRIDKFGDFIETFSAQKLRRNVGEFEGQFLRALEVFPFMKEEAEGAFRDILSSKEKLVSSVTDNFRQLASRVGDDIERMSVNVRQEFSEMERGTQAAFGRMSSRLLKIAENTGKASKSFAKLDTVLEKITPSIAKSFEGIEDAAKKADKQNLGLLRTLNRLQSAFKRTGIAADRLSKRLVTIGEISFQEHPRGYLAREPEKQFLEETGERIERLRRVRRPRRSQRKEEEERRAKRILESSEEVSLIVNAINAMSSKLSGQLSRVQQTLGRLPATAQPKIEGTLEVESDELKRSFITSIRTKRGRKGGAR